MNQCKYLKKIDEDNNYIKNYLKGSVGIITSQIFKKIDDDDNNYIKNYLKGSVGIITSKIFKENIKC